MKTFLKGGVIRDWNVVKWFLVFAFIHSNDIESE